MALINHNYMTLDDYSINANDGLIDDHNTDNNHNADDRNDGKYSPPPGLEGTCRAYKDLQKILKPNQKTGPKFNPIMQERLNQVHQFLWNYMDPETTAYGGTASSSWKAALEQTAHMLGRGNYLA